jgi:putative inorganic carbon (hco3(-)) transporter
MALAMASANNPAPDPSAPVRRKTKSAVPRYAIDDLFALRLRAFLGILRSEHFSFWMICGYFIIEYVRPQSILPVTNILPWAQVFLTLAAIGWVIDRQRSWVKDSTNVWMTLFLLVIVASSVTATYPDVSWSHYFDFLGWYVIYFLLINTVTTSKRFTILIALFLLASVKLAFFGARTWAFRGFSFTSWGLMGPSGYFENSGELAIQMLMFSPIAYEIALFLRPRVSRLKYLILLLFPITGAMTVIGTSSRGGQIGLLYQVYRTFIRRRLSLRTILLVASLIVVGYWALPGEQKLRFISAGSDRTSQQRILYWRHGMEMIQAHPFLGVGYFNFQRYYESHYPRDMLYPTAQLPHNIFIQVGTDAGASGLLIYIMLLYRNLKCTREIRKLCSGTDSTSQFAASVAGGLATALLGFIIAGQFVSVAYYPFLWINLAMTVALKNIAKLNSSTTTSLARTGGRR